MATGMTKTKTERNTEEMSCDKKTQRQRLSQKSGSVAKMQHPDSWWSKKCKDLNKTKTKLT